MTPVRAALASIAGLTLTVGVVAGATTLSSAEPGGHGNAPAACAQQQKQ